MATTAGDHQTETVGLPVVGREGDTCEQCGSALATDQRYCVNCGWRRGEARVDYERRLGGDLQASSGAVAAPQGPASQWTPAFAILAIALLGVMLLLGVLIGKKGNNDTQTVAAQAAPTTTTAAAPTTDTTATTASKTKAGKGAAAAAPGAGNVVQGGSGNTQGIQAADTNGNTVQNAKNGPNVVATQGKPETLDPNGQAGGGSGATCIGC
jgi:preprotein translocase subunit SecG